MAYRERFRRVARGGHSISRNPHFKSNPPIVISQRMFLSIWVGVVMAGGQTGCTMFNKQEAATSGPGPVAAETRPAQVQTPAGSGRSGSVRNPDYYNIPKVPPPGARVSYNSVSVNGPYIAMTFDDGPHATNTPRLLDMLAQRNIKATFFVVGTNVREYPQITRRILAEGHELANHTWSHQALSGLSVDGVRQQLAKTDAAVREATGYQMRLMRPPYGATNLRVKQQCFEEFGYPTILWSVDPLDWKRPGSGVVAQRIISATHPGAIILAHDIHGATIDAMPQTLDALLAKGYKFVTVSQLLNLAASNPGPAAAAAPAHVTTADAGSAAPAPVNAPPSPAPAPAAPLPPGGSIPQNLPPVVNGIPFEGAPPVAR
jgi:peptidoglycan/xylan/chitin deacetylase (PgdA/CDA1 family)